MSGMPVPSLDVSSSVAELAVAFPQHLQLVFDRLEEIRDEMKSLDALKRPSDDTIDWAQKVLLGVVPSTYLRDAEINPFEREIHVTWECEESGKSVIVFFTAPAKFKIYYELLKNNVVTDHDLVTTENIADVSNRLRWFFE